MNIQIKKTYRLFQGIIIKSKMDKTIVVLVIRKVRHIRYGKIIKKYKKYFVHDKNNITKIGDKVIFTESKPISKHKRWILKTILR